MQMHCAEGHVDDRRCRVLAAEHAQGAHGVNLAANMSTIAAQAQTYVQSIYSGRNPSVAYLWRML